jgi:predicted AlkP superfamily phosphohydrolase/phosphomutase
MSPVLAEQWMAEGYLPTFARLAEEGTFRPLTTTIPSLSPSAWSSFATCVNPGRHGVMDLLHRDPQRYLPLPSFLDISLDIDPEGKRPPIPILRNAMKAPPFWDAALQQGVSSTVYRLPIGFPVKDMPGGLFTPGFGVPDTRGSMTDFVSYRTDLPEGVWPSSSPTGGGKQVGIRATNGMAESQLWIARHPLTHQEIIAPLRIRADRVNGCVTVEIQGRQQTAAVGEWSDWIEVQAAVPPLPDIWGIFRFMVVSIEPELWVVAGSINQHPARPFMPISYPADFVPSLAQDLGLFRTLGVGQDTEAWLGGEVPLQFLLDDLYLDYRRQEEICDYVFRHYPANLNVHIYTQNDQMQHFFYGIDDPRRSSYTPEDAARFGDVALRMYQYTDGLLARVLERYVDENTTLMVLSDHGIGGFRRTVNLNTWLIQNGFMQAKLAVNQNFHDIGTGKPFFRHVRWSETQAYSLGVGIYLNLKGRESLGIVEPGEEAERVRAAIIAELPKAVDPKTGVRPVRDVYDAREVYHGPYAAGDLITGMEDGYRTSWQSIMGGVEAEVFNDNVGVFIADHQNLHAGISSGVFFSNRKFNVARPNIMDLGVTALETLGVRMPPGLDGQSLL